MFHKLNKCDIANTVNHQAVLQCFFWRWNFWNLQMFCIYCRWCFCIHRFSAGALALLSLERTPLFSLLVCQSALGRRLGCCIFDSCSAPPGRSWHAASVHMVAGTPAATTAIKACLGRLVIHDLHRHRWVHCSGSPNTRVLNWPGTLLAHRDVHPAGVRVSTLALVPAVIVRRHRSPTLTIAVIVVLSSWADKLRPVPSHVDSGLVGIDAAISFHKESLAFLSAGFDNSAGAVAIAIYTGCFVHGMDVVLWTSPR